MKRTIARRSRLTFGALIVAALGLAGVGCGGGGYVAPGYYAGPGWGPYWGPYWYPDTYGTYAYVDVPWWGDPPPPPKNDPRRKDSPTHRAIADQVHSSMTGRGYKTSGSDADLDVTVYASTDKQLDISGYTHIYDWKNLPKLKKETKFPKGTVVVDVLQPKTHVLLWRGIGEAAVSDDVDEYSKNLREAVDKVLEKYPKSKKG
ncbi:MAG TPA: DUF4136 domain-containing protein [Gemmatimonadaceae bacterium]